MRDNPTGLLYAEARKTRKMLPRRAFGLMHAVSQTALAGVSSGVGELENEFFIDKKLNENKLLNCNTAILCELETKNKLAPKVGNRVLSAKSRLCSMRVELFRFLNAAIGMNAKDDVSRFEAARVSVLGATPRECQRLISKESFCDA